MRPVRMAVKRGVSLALSFSLLVLSPGLDCYRAVAHAQGAASRGVVRRGLPAAPSGAASIRTAPPARVILQSPVGTSLRTLPSAPGAQAAPAAVAPGLTAPAALSLRSLGTAEAKNAPAAPGVEATPFERMLGALEAPSLLESLPSSPASEASKGAGEEEFNLRLGRAPRAALPGSDASIGETSGGPARLARPGRSSGRDAETLPAVSKDPASMPKERSTSMFPAAMAAAVGALGLILKASAAAVSGLTLWAAGGPAVDPGAGLAGAISFAGSAVLVAAAALAGGALVSAGVFAAVMFRGRKVNDSEFFAFIESETTSGRMDPGVAERIRIHKPGPGFPDLTYGYHQGGLIYLRRELIASPLFFKMTLAHELAHLRAGAARGPPRRGLRGLGRTVLSELSAKAAEVRSFKSLAPFTLPLMDRIMRKSQVSLRLDHPFEVLVLNPASKELSDPQVYGLLSGGQAKVETVAAADPIAELSKPERAGRAQAVVMDGTAAILPKAESAQGKRLARALRQLDSLYLLAMRRTSAAPAAGENGFVAGSKDEKRFLALAKAARELVPGDAKAQATFEGKVRELWRELSAAQLPDIGPTRFIEGLYASLRNKGTAFLAFRPGEKGVREWERLLRFWEEPGGGQFRVARVDLEDGSHFLVVRKVEARVGVWLRPRSGTLERSIIGADSDPALAAEARAAMEAAGFKDQLPEFDRLGIEVRDVYGSRDGRQEIYVTIPRRNVDAVKHMVSRLSAQVGASQADFESHLMNSAKLQSVPPIWDLGITGAGGSIMWIGTGGDATRPDFGGRLEVIDRVGEGPEDWIGHETHVAAISISGDSTYTGLAKAATGIVAKVFSRDTPGASDGGIMGSAVLAKERGMDVINVSLGSRGTSGDNLSIFLSNLTLQKNSKGDPIIVVGSFGNAGPFDRTGSQPSAGVNVIAVAAAAKSVGDGRPEISFYSSVGPDVDPRFAAKRVRLKPDLTAIGGDVVTEPGNPDAYKDGITAAKSKDMAKGPSDTEDGLHTRMSGTSMASPMVAGVALLLKLSFKMTGASTAFTKENLPVAIKAILMETSDDLGVPVWFQGSGLVNAWRAVRAVTGSVGQALALKAGTFLNRLVGRPAPALTDPWGWIADYKAVMDLEDKVYAGSLTNKTEGEARVEDQAYGDLPGIKPPGSDADPAAKPVSTPLLPSRAAVAGGSEATQSLAAFEAKSAEALPALLEYLKHPNWIVRRQAALVLLNLRMPAAAADLARVASQDGDRRVRQLALLALAEVQAKSMAPYLTLAVQDARWDTSFYAAYALARQGDSSKVSILTEGTRHADKFARFTAVWLLGQLRRPQAEQADALAAVVRDYGERGNIRHLAVASLVNAVAVAPDSATEAVIRNLLESAGPQNLALTRTIAKFFPVAFQSQAVLERLRKEPLRTVAAGFIESHRGSIQKPGALGELVRLLARQIGVSLDQPTPVPDPQGKGMAGVDPLLGPLDLVIEIPEGAAPEEAAAELGLELSARYEGEVRAVLPLSRGVWVSVPEHKVYALARALRARGWMMRRAQPLYSQAATGSTAKAVVQIEKGVRIVAIGADPLHGTSEAAVMAEIEREAAAVKDPLAEPTIFVLEVGGSGSAKRPLQRLLKRLADEHYGLVIAAGNLGPAGGTLLLPVDEGRAAIVAAAGRDGALKNYSSRGPPDKAPFSWADYVEDGAQAGTAVAARRSAVKLAALTVALKAGKERLPNNWFLEVIKTAQSSLKPMVGALEGTPGILDDSSEPLGPLAKGSSGAPAPGGDAASELYDLRQVLGDGTRTPSGPIAPFVFRPASGGSFRARASGLEGFLYSKLELEAKGLGAEQLPDYFRYLTALLAPVPWAGTIAREIRKIESGGMSPEEKNSALNRVLISAVRELQARAGVLDESGWSRDASTYMILARAYNKMKPGKNFFDSLDDSELLDIRRRTKADVLWILDIWEIGDFRRWGTGGGSPYAIKGYRVKPDLGGEAGLKSFIERAHRLGFKVALDEIPNHVSLDSDLVKEHPEALLHMVPPQHLSEAEIMAAVPRQTHGDHAPVFFLVENDHYPENGRRVKKRVLLHHPLTDFGGDMWVDMAQRDFSRPVTRAQESAEVRRLHAELGVDMVRRDMSYEVLNARFYPRWLKILSDERDRSSGWVRDEMDRMIAAFQERWAALGGAEYLEEATRNSQAAVPHAAAIDEAYSNFTELSRSGSSAVYNKNDHDLSMGQAGLYDSMTSGDGRRIRAALRHIAFRRWQKGGAGSLQFVGTHDGGEGNPVDKFGRNFKAAALSALLLRPILLYNGVELGSTQREQIIGDLSKSVDTAKAIPFDIPVLIDWKAVRKDNQEYLLKLLDFGDRSRKLLAEGSMEVLEPNWEDTRLAAWSVASGGPALIAAANFGDRREAATFSFGEGPLKDFGSFRPKVGSRYVFKDALNNGNDGQPVSYERSGTELRENGLFIELDPGGVHLFEVSEIPAAPITGPPGAPTAHPAGGDSSVPEVVSKPSSWDLLTEKLTKWALVPFTLLQVPQIIMNITNLIGGNPEALSILPWMGYSTGILGNMLLLSYFASQKEKGASLVQGVGVITSAVVVTQIFLAGFMPGLAFAVVMPAIVAGLVLNFLQLKGKLPEKLWKGWSRASGLLGLAVLPQVLWATFAPAAMASMIPAIAAGVLGLGMLGLEASGKMPKGLKNVWGALSAWTATLLFMYGPVAQAMSNYTHPEGMAGISVATLLLAMAGNLLMLPRAVLTKNLIWYTGSGWGVYAGGLLVLAWMYALGLVSSLLFWPAALATVGWTAFLIYKARKEVSR